MFKNFKAILAALLVLCGATVASAQLVQAPSYRNTVLLNNTSANTINTFSELIPACPNMYFKFTQSSAAVASVYNVAPTDNTAALIEANTRIVQLKETKVYGPYTPTLSFVRVIVDTRETSSTPSTVEISCGTSPVTYVIPNPQTTQGFDATAMIQTSPAPVKMGFGFQTEGTPNFTGTLYTDTGPEPTPSSVQESDHQFGWYYNGTGPDAIVIPNMWQTHWNMSVEANYRPAGQSTMEWNWDFVPPDIESTLTGVTGSFQVGDVITCASGTASAMVKLVGPPLRFRQNFGACVAGDTITNQTRSGTGVLGTLTQVPAAGTVFRPFLFLYNKMDHTAAYVLESSAGNNTFGVSAGYARHHGRIITAAVHWNTATWNSGTVVAAGACNTTNVGLSGTGFDGTQSAATDVIRWSFNGDVTGVTGFNPSTGVLSIFAYPGANTVNFKLCNTTAGSLTLGANVTINWIVDRPL